MQLSIRLSDGFRKDVFINTIIHAKKTVTLPAFLTEISEEAFMGAGAEEVILQEGITSIGPRAFANSSVKLITIPACVTDITEDAFEGCDVTFIVVADSYAEAFAQEHGMKCSPVSLAGFCGTFAGVLW